MITGKDLMEWGMEQGPIFRTALKVLGVSRKGFGKPQVEAAFKEMLKNPDLFTGHELLSSIAQELIKSRAVAVEKVKIVNDEDVPVWGSPIDLGALQQIKMCARTAERVALMGDHHKGYSCPIGGVVAYKGQISPSCVGYDIACGNKAVLTNADANDVRKNIGRIMDDVCRRISFGVGRSSVKEV